MSETERAARLIERMNNETKIAVARISAVASIGKAKGGRPSKAPHERLESMSLRVEADMAAEFDRRAKRVKRPTCEYVREALRRFLEATGWRRTQKPPGSLES